MATHVILVHCNMMMANRAPVPKKKFIFSLVELLLLSEDATKEWLSSPPLLKAYYFVMIGGVAAVVSAYLLPVFF
jgi:hypothetical protein